MENNLLGEKIRETCRKKNLTQEQLGEKMGYTQQKISHWVTGRSIPTIEQIDRFRDVTGVDLMPFILTERKGDEQVNIYKPIRDIDTYEKAKDAADEILKTAGIKDKYSYPVYRLCQRLIPPVIGMLHYSFITSIDNEGIPECVDYRDIFVELHGLLEMEDEQRYEDLCINACENGEPCPERNRFNSILEDNFDWFDKQWFNYKSCNKYDDITPYKNYYRQTVWGWYEFQYAAGMRRGNPTQNSPILDELYIAIDEIIDIYSKFDKYSQYHPSYEK